VSEYFAARVRAEWQDWSFGANQAAARAAAAEELIALRRQYTELSEQDLLRLAQSWRSDSGSGPYFAFIAADGGLYGANDSNGPQARGFPNPAEPTAVLVDAAFVSALFHELADQAPAALAALLDQWSEQRRHAAHAGLRQVPAKPPRVSLLLPRDDSLWPAACWEHLLGLDLEAPSLDGSVINCFRFGSGARRP
jgi:hypothetical protein